MSDPSGTASSSHTGLGVTPRGGGLDVAVFSSVAERVELCLFDAADGETRVALDGGEDGVWRGRVEGAGEGQRYGFRAHGPFDPARGLWCDGAKLLLDPYGRALAGPLRRGDELRRVGEDSANVVPRSVVVADRDHVGALPRRAWEDTVLYEVHVRGATVQHPAVPKEQRGTYLGFAHNAVVEHLVALGVTAVELLPVYEWFDEPALEELGLTDYWGYNPISFFAPTRRYASVPAGDPAAPLREFAEMVATLHRAGIEVILDVVYNHTAEGGAHGDTVSFKGLDAPAYYRIEDGTFVDTTGCGTSLNAEHPAAQQLVVDSLRYWAEAYGVDGFRFDLAPTLARVDGRFEPTAPILRRLADDPVLSERKLIVEPWDVGCEDSAVLGRFGPPFREWNGKFRDTVRDFWRGRPNTLGQLATRLGGSRDLFADRGATATVNFVTCHDGFTLHDLVTYDRKHNGANLEHDRDGADDNRSWNCGVEGETDDEAIRSLRAGQVRSLLATLLLSRGVPMLLGGDELGRSQQGNNNPYSQDNEVSWFQWADADPALVDVVRRLLELRRRHARLLGDDGVQPTWCSPLGVELEEGEWAHARALAMCLVDGADALVVLVNGDGAPSEFHVPTTVAGDLVVAFESAIDARATARALGPSGALEVPGRAVTVLVRPR